MKTNSRKKHLIAVLLEYDVVSKIFPLLWPALQEERGHILVAILAILATFWQGCLRAVKRLQR